VREDKEREAADGFDGTWVAHPDLVAVAREVFDRALGEGSNQLDRLRPEVHVGAADLLAVAATPGDITEAGLRNNIGVGIRYLAAWLGGAGAAAIFNLMEDVATAEIARSQVWQWLHQGVRLADGTPVRAELIHGLCDEEAAAARGEPGAVPPRVTAAQDLFERLVFADEFVEFLTLPGYDLLPEPQPASDQVGSPPAVAHTGG
jgi:malate synthase